MKKIYSVMGKVDVAEMSLADAFVDYLNDNYYPDAAQELDAETVKFEYNNFLMSYAK